jgi:hypothetical protein
VPKQIDKIKIELYKDARLRGASIKGAMLKAGYKPSTAHHSSTEGVVKRCEPELQAMVKASDISVDWVLNRLNTELKSTDAKASDRIRICELLGKYLNMFKDNQVTQVSVFTGDMVKDLPPIDITQEVNPSQGSNDATSSNSKG